jgi:hypothetical protein
VGAQPHWRYCGSLLPMAMDETDTPRQVVIADLPADGGPAQIEIRAIPSPRAYARLAGPVPEVQAAIRRLPPPAAGELVPWCDLTLEADLLDPGLLRDLGDAVEAQGWKTLAIRRRQTAVAGADLLAPGAADAADPLPPSLTPEAIFVAVAASQGVAADDDLRADFAALLAEVQAQGQGV